MRRLGLLPVLLAAVVVLILEAGATTGWANDDNEELPFKSAEFFIEFNSTASDAGVQMFLDGDDWKRIRISNPNGRTIFDVRGKKTLGRLGLTELFFESVEPELSELPLTEFMALFPAGTYEFEGITNEGIKLESEVEFTHVIPCGPVVSPDGGACVNPGDPVVISWVPVTEVVDPITEACAPGPVTIVSYQVIVEREDLAGYLTVILPSSATQATIPTELIAPGTAYIFEVLAKETSGNQTITEGAFVTCD